MPSNPNPFADLEVKPTASPTRKKPSLNQIGFLRNLLAERDLTDINVPEDLTTLTGGRGGTASMLIDILLNAPKKTNEQVMEDWHAGALDISEIPAGTYADPRHITDPDNEDASFGLIRIDKPSHGKWEGWIFVKNGSEYAMSDRRYGTQRPGGRYSGQVEDQLRRILESPLDAARAYGSITARCSSCGRQLENEESVALGIGPVCRQRWF